MENKSTIKKRKKKVSTPVKVLKVTGTVILSMMFIVIITGSIFATALTIYVLNYVDSTTPISLDNVEMNFTSSFLAQNPDYNEDDPNTEPYSTYYTLTQNGERRVWVDLEQVPKYVRDSFVYSEDERFYSHDGVDFKRTFAAFANMILHFADNDFGGSTITQQTIKNITSDDEDQGAAGITRKIREITRSINIEKTYTKDEILESYLNIISLNTNRYNIRGVQAAANFYFSKDISALSLGEAASLAAITKNPSWRNPYDHLDNNYERRANILKTMLNNGAISSQEYETALNEEIVITGDLNFSSGTDTILDSIKSQGVASYYIDESIKETRSIFQEIYGLSYDAASEKLSGGGYTIYTNVDIKMQQEIEEKFKTDSTFQKYAFDNDELWAAFYCMDYSGNVKAVVGNRGEKKSVLCWNNATQSLRSPGSTIKPIASYGPALQKDFIHWSSMFKDEPIVISNDGIESFWPKNYSEVANDDNWSKKNFTATKALALSLNTVPAQIVELLTPSYSFSFLQDNLKISTLEEKYDANYSPMVVGGMRKGIKLSELVSAYQVFGSGGKHYDAHYISQIVDREGAIIYSAENSYENVLDESTSYIMNRMLKTVIDDSDGTGNAAKVNGVEVVGKTGTSQDWQNLTFVACTPQYVSGVWVGYENVKKIETAKYNSISKIWKNIFGDIAANEEVKEFEASETVKQLKYCTVSGKLASKTCTSSATGYYKESNIPEYCSGNH
ncbi:MAG: peptidoglycan glycosyltransferase [Clostridiales bacterium]|nr:peptidoglycan glycosyltransferase [Clostridiales bacterium]